MGATTDAIRVLHVNDDPDFGDMAATILLREDDRLAVQPVPNADPGLAAIADREFDCIVSDYVMPGMSGIAFLETIREDDPELPFILFTGKGSEEVASEAINAGVTDYFQKESGTDQYAVLTHRVTNAVDRLRAEREVKRTGSQLEAIADNAVDGIVIIDSESEITFANPAMKTLFGYTPENWRASR